MFDDDFNKSLWNTFLFYFLLGFLHEKFFNRKK